MIKLIIKKISNVIYISIYLLATLYFIAFTAFDISKRFNLI